MTLHKDEMLEAAEKARQEYLHNHPEANTDLKYDPVKLLEKSAYDSIEVLNFKSIYSYTPPTRTPLYPYIKTTPTIRAVFIDPNCNFIMK